ncbi:hypothetical protein KY361_02005 [Candidatus Woesearchaeota archaeon]|nr:hypothetical protein [Candidatus Woesearchaeota archaeon]
MDYDSHTQTGLICEEITEYAKSGRNRLHVVLDRLASIELKGIDVDLSREVITDSARRALPRSKEKISGQIPMTDKYVLHYTVQPSGKLLVAHKIAERDYNYADRKFFEEKVGYQVGRILEEICRQQPEADVTLRMSVDELLVGRLKRYDASLGIPEQRAPKEVVRLFGEFEGLDVALEHRPGSGYSLAYYLSGEKVFDHPLTEADPHLRYSQIGLILEMLLESNPRANSALKIPVDEEATAWLKGSLNGPVAVLIARISGSQAAPFLARLSRSNSS